MRRRGVEPQEQARNVLDIMVFGTWEVEELSDLLYEWVDGGLEREWTRTDHERLHAGLRLLRDRIATVGGRDGVEAEVNGPNQVAGRVRALSGWLGTAPAISPTAWGDQ